MKRRGYMHILPSLILLSLFSLYGCAGSADVSRDDSRTVAAEKQNIQKAEPEPAEPSIQKENGSDTPDTYEMDQVKYDETKKDLAVLVEEINLIIADKNYDRWLTHLTKDYIEYYSDPETLHELSQSPLMIKYNIKLRTLRDYFSYVVVASRKDVRIDNIKPLSENKVKAHMMVNNEPIVVYTLEKVDERWKITK